MHRHRRRRRTLDATAAEHVPIDLDVNLHVDHDDDLDVLLDIDHHDHHPGRRGGRAHVRDVSGTWSERRVAIMVMTADYLAEGGVGALVDPVRTMCPEDLARQEAAGALEQRASGASDRLQGADLLSEIACADSTMVVTFTNLVGEPLGMTGGARPSYDPDAPVLRPVDRGFVVWSIAPDAAQPLSMPLSVLDGECSFNGILFFADAGAADTAIPGGPGPETTGDDPAMWLPALVQADLTWRSAPTAAGIDDLEDVRSLGRDRRVEAVADPDVHPLVAATVCPGTVDQPSSELVAFAYRVEHAPATVDGALGPEEHLGYSTLSFAAFRRGSDGRWRWLTTPLPLTGALMGADCGPLVPHP